MANVIVYDDESEDLTAEGELLSFGYKWLGKKRVYLPSVLDYFKPCSEGRLHYNDRLLVIESHKVLSSADMMVTFNGKNFDWKMHNTKFLLYGLPPIQPIPHVDLYQVAKHNLLIRGKSLENLGRVLGLKNQKLKLPFSVWRAATKGDVKSLKLIIAHNKADVLMTEELYYKLRHLVRQHPRLNGYEPCRRCGKDALERRGRAITIYRGQQWKFHCTSCGAWETRAA